jgi:hypothetical protein
MLLRPTRHQLLSGVVLRFLWRLHLFWRLRDRRRLVVGGNYSVFRPRSIHNVSHQKCARSKDEQHRCQRKPTPHERQISHGIRITSESRPQTEIKIGRRRHSAETADYLPQPGLLLVKLTALATLAQVRSRRRAARLIQHQLIKFLTNHSTIVFSHNFFTYK